MKAKSLPMMAGAFAVFAAAASLVAQSAPSAPHTRTGTLCILPHPKQADVRTGSPSMPPPAMTYTLQLDGGVWVPLSSDTRVFLGDIPYDARHKVAIRGDGKPSVAFTFTFAEHGSSELCLFQNDFYLWWQIFQTRLSFKSCRCEGVPPAVWRR